jgi:hypothetical protein
MGSCESIIPFLVTAGASCSKGSARKCGVSAAASGAPHARVGHPPNTFKKSTLSGHSQSVHKWNNNF